MKNSLLVVLILVLAIFAFQTNYKLNNKPQVYYTISNSFPVVSGDTIHIQFQFDSESDLKFFVANLQSEIGAGKFNEKIEFAGGKKSGDLSYSFIVPNNYHLESILNFDFSVANKFSTEKVFIAIPIYNPPHDIIADLELTQGNGEFVIQSFFSSRSLMLTNDLLANITEVENFSHFTINDLVNFKMPSLTLDEIIIQPKELIASNLLNENENLVKNDNELLAANFISITSLNDIIESEITSKPEVEIIHETRINSDETHLTERNKISNPENIVSAKMQSNINAETKKVSNKLTNKLKSNNSTNDITPSVSVNSKQNTIHTTAENVNELKDNEIKLSESTAIENIKSDESTNLKLKNIEIELKTLNISDENIIVNMKLEETEEEFVSLGVALAKSSEIQIQIK